VLHQRSLALIALAALSWGSACNALFGIDDLGIGDASPSAGAGGAPSGDECAEELDDCDEHATCLDTPGGFECTCIAGYLGDGRECHHEFVVLDTGYSHSCAVDSAGALWCWGRGDAMGLDASSVLTPRRIGSDSDWQRVATGYRHTCAIKSDGSLWCWGRNDFGKLGLGDDKARPEPTRVGEDDDWVAVSAGTNHSCATRDGDGVYCWGYNASGQLGTGDQLASTTPVSAASGDYRDVSAHYDSSCAVQEEGLLYCWGNNTYAQLGTGDVGDRLSPTLVGPTQRFSRVATGVHTCAIHAADSSLWCWGGNGRGQSGTVGTTIDVPTLFDDGEWVDVTVGGEHSCGVRADGRVLCWGMALTGQLGHDPGTQKAEPLALEGEDWIGVNAGPTSSCGWREGGRAFCWGATDYGQLGNGETIHSLTPVRVGTDDDWRSVSVNYAHSCAIKTDNRLFCWGTNDIGRLGIGSSVSSETPVQVPGGWTQVAAGVHHTCALDLNSWAWCWGLNAEGQLGVGATPPGSSSPLAVSVDGPFDALAAGDHFNCALRDTGTLFCWGDNGFGQLGIGNTNDQPIPQSVEAGGNAFLNLGLGNRHACAVQDDPPSSRLMCWGSAGRGEIGDTVAPFLPSPQLVPAPATPWVAVAAGEEFTCSRNEGGSVFCWGGNPFGELGQGTSTAGGFEPVEVGAGGWSDDVLAAGGHAIAASNASGLSLWGFNMFGQLGIGSTALIAPPSALPMSWTSIALSSHGCGVAADGSLWCWGRSAEGQVGQPGAWTTGPVAVADD
jgi:alpha-tubulin suppressor-like RCC1 family protein